MRGERLRRAVLPSTVVVLLLIIVSVPAPAAGTAVTVPYSSTPVATSDLDGNPATGAWSDADSWAIPLENGQAAPYGSATLFAKHDGTSAYFRIDGKVDVAWVSPTGNHFWLGMAFSPSGTSHHGGSGTWDGVFFGDASYTPAPTYPPSSVDTNGFAKPPAKDTAQSDLGKMAYSGTAAPYSFTAEWKRSLNTGDAQDVAFVADGTTAYNFFITTDSDGGGSSGGAIDHSKITNLNTMRFALPVAGDTTPPTVSITAPATNTFTNAAVTITADASDNVGVTRVEFYAGPTLLGTDTTVPYAQVWDTTAAAEGRYTVAAKAYDAANNNASSSIFVTVDRSAPVADAGPDAGVSPGGTFTFDGSGSSDANGIASYTWTFTDGTPQSLSGVGPSHTFNSVGTYPVTLAVADPAGNTGTDSMVVTVTQDNQPPVARAGAVQSVLQGSLVQLDGSASTDDVGIANYTWTFDDAGTVTLWGVVVSYRFVRTGAFQITLTVRDYSSKTGSGTTWVNVTADTVAPTARAGPDVTIALGDSVTLNGSSSTDNVGVVNYTWDVEGTSLLLYGAVVNLTPADAGVFMANLTVRDGAGLTSSDALSITVIGPDRVPPDRLPAPLATTSGPGAVRLAWDSSPATDLAGYLVLRAGLQGGPYVQLNREPIVNTSYLDTGLRPGQTYWYEVVAIDLAGNPSSPSPQASGIAGAAPAASFDWLSVRWVLVPVATAAALVGIAFLAWREAHRDAKRVASGGAVPPPPPKEGTP